MESLLFNSESHEKRVVVLYGITGSGKTQLAYNLYRRNSSRFDAVFSVSGRSDTEFHRDLNSLDIPYRSNDIGFDQSLVAGQPTTQKAANDMKDYASYLNQKGNSNWLLLIDDVPSVSDGNDQTSLKSKPSVMAFLQQLSQGFIVITAQSIAVSRLGNPIDVSELTQQESLSLIQRTVGNSKSLSESGELPKTSSGSSSIPLIHYIKTPQMRSENSLGTDLHSFVDRIGRHAQTVDVASVYLRDKAFGSVETFLARWNTSRTGKFSNDPMLNINQKLFFSLKLAVDGLEGDLPRFVSLLAFLDHRDIWMRMFRRSEETPIWFQRLVMGEDTLEAAIDALKGTSLLRTTQSTSRSPALASFSLHPAVQAMAQNRASETLSDLEELLNLTIRLVGAEICQWSSSSSRDMHKRLDPQARQCYNNILLLDKHSLVLSEITLQAVSDLGRFFHNSGNLKKAQVAYERALAGYKAIPRWNIKQRDRCYTTINSLGLIHIRNRRFPEARSCFQEVIDHFSKQDASTIDVTSQMADVKINLRLATIGDLDVDTTLMQSLDDHIINCSTNTAQYHVKRLILGTVYKKQGDLEQAKQLLYETRGGLSALLIQDTRNLVGNSMMDSPAYDIHYFLIQLDHTLADIYFQENNFRDARKTLKSARQRIIQYCGENSDHLLESEWIEVQIANAEYLETRQGAKKTCQAFRTLSKKQEKRFGKSNPKTLRTDREYGHLLVKLGEWDCAGKVLHKSLAAYKNFSEGSYECALTMYYLGGMYSDQGDMASSVKWYDTIHELLAQQGDALSGSWYLLRYKALIKRARILQQFGAHEDSVKAVLECASLPNLYPRDRDWIQKVSKERDKVI
jgi:tetratricopeptide (TPR) repeat protein